MIGYLIFSNKCKECASFFQIIQREGLINFFNALCIDNMSVQDISKLQINKVPAVIISDNSGNKNIFEASDAFKWLNNIVTSRRQNIYIADMQRKKILETNAKTGIDVGMGYCPSETSGTTDDYSYLITDHAQPKSFMPYGQDESYSIATLNNIKESSLSESDHKQMMKQYSNNRNNQDGTLKEMIDKNLKETLINNMSGM